MPSTPGLVCQYVYFCKCVCGGWLADLQNTANTDAARKQCWVAASQIFNLRRGLRGYNDFLRLLIWKDYKKSSDWGNKRHSRFSEREHWPSHHRRWQRHRVSERQGLKISGSSMTCNMPTNWLEWHLKQMAFKKDCIGEFLLKYILANNLCRHQYL